jgi:prenyltransferase beta subunit
MKLVNRLLPLGPKQRLKCYLLASLSAEPEVISRIATRVVKTGVVNYLNWSYQDERLRTLNHLARQRTGGFEYRFSTSSTKPTLYSSIYACMLMGLHGELPCMSEKTREGWLAYFDSFQCESDGLFRDPVIAGDEFESDGVWGDGWGIRHLAAHIIVGYARLGGIPGYPFRFLEPYYETSYLNSWLDKFNFSCNVWSSSNYIMNLYTLLQFARDYMGESEAERPIELIGQWLAERQSPETGMWNDYKIDGYPLLGDAIRGAYHFFPLFVYEGKPILYREKAIDWILKSQNSWGGFEEEKRPSGACEDIDALEPLIRFVSQTHYRKEDADLAVRRALVWVLAHRNADGGYESLMENGCHYGLHPQTTSRPGESNLFATWFRTLTLAYMTKYLGMDSGFNIGRFPGYEIPLA